MYNEDGVYKETCMIKTSWRGVGVGRGEGVVFMASVSNTDTKIC